MKNFIARQLMSFVKAPIGYVVNLLCTLSSCLGRYEPEFLECGLARLGQAFCISDGVQDDWCELVPNWAIRILPRR
jgi:hypothetical protein